MRMVAFYLFRPLEFCFLILQKLLLLCMTLLLPSCFYINMHVHIMQVFVFLHTAHLLHGRAEESQ